MQASGRYTRVSRRQKLSNFSGQKHVPDIEPDNIGLTTDGKIDIIEIKSPRQRIDELQSKLERAWNELPADMRGEYRIINPEDAFK